MKIAICGGTISGATLARILSSSTSSSSPAGIVQSIDLYRCLHDPARSKPHPLCEYEPLSFSLSKLSSSTTSSSASSSSSTFCESFVEEEVQRWMGEGLVQRCNIQTGVGPRMGVYHNNDNSKRSDGAKNTPSKKRKSNNQNGVIDDNKDRNIVRRYQPRKGFFTLIDKLIDDLPTPVRVVSKNQVVALEERRQEPQQQRQQQEDRSTASWFLRDAQNGCHGPYDVVLFAYDSKPRAARKASFKQLLETALPVSSSIIHSLSRAVAASAMTAIVSFSQRETRSRSLVLHDCIRFEGVPAVRFATRNRTNNNGSGSDAASHRGMARTSNDDDVWTLVATPEWSHGVRKTHSNKWNKKAVGDDIVKAFANAVGAPNLSSSYRSVVPTFHWQGSSSITKIATGGETRTTTTDGARVGTASLFAYDANTGLGFCGDVFGGQGVEGALRSAADLADHLLRSPDASRLPVTADAWTLRTPPGSNNNEGNGDNHDTNSVFGSFTGRDEPRGKRGPDGLYDLLDHTWPTAVDIANGKSVESADSLAKYRKNKRGGGSNNNNNRNGGSLKNNNSNSNSSNNNNGRGRRNRNNNNNNNHRGNNNNNNNNRSNQQRRGNGGRGNASSKVTNNNPGRLSVASMLLQNEASATKQ